MFKEAGHWAYFETLPELQTKKNHYFFPEHALGFIKEFEQVEANNKISPSSNNCKNVS